MTRPWLILLGVVLLGAVVFNGADARFAKAEARRYAAENDSLRRVGARIDTQYVRDTVRLYRQVVRLDTLTQTVTEWMRDTVKVIEYVQQADSTVRACLAVVETCEARVSNRDARIAALEGQARALAAQRPTWRDRVKPIVVWGGLGWLAGRAGVP